MVTSKKQTFAKKITANRKKDESSQDSRQQEFTGKRETIEEFLARGGEIEVLPPKLGPDEEPGGVRHGTPRRLYKGWGVYEV